MNHLMVKSIWYDTSSGPNKLYACTIIDDEEATLKLAKLNIDMTIEIKRMYPAFIQRRYEMPQI